MKVTILHGDDYKKSRERLSQIKNALKKRNWEIISFDDKQKRISDYLTTNSLFSVSTLFVIENIKNLTKDDFKWINDDDNQDIDVNILIWSKSSINKTFLKNFKIKYNLEEFKISAEIFLFLDNLIPNNTEKLLNIFYKLKQNENIEIIFAMMGRHFRDLYWVSVDEKSLKTAPWRISKLKSQAKKFNNSDTLKSLINYLAQIDIDSKTGITNLSISIDQFLLKL